MNTSEEGYKINYYSYSNIYKRVS